MLIRQQRVNLSIVIVLGVFIVLSLVAFLFQAHQFSSVPRSKHVVGAGVSPLLYGSNIDISELLPTSPYYIKDSKGEDLIDIAHRLGITAFRISSVLQSFSYQTPDVIYTKDQWDMVLNKMAANGIKAMIIAETHTSTVDTTATPDAITNTFLQRVKAYLIDTNVGDNPDVYAIDLKNEPVLTDSNLAMLQQEATMVKQRYPHIPLTIGGWRVPNGTYDSKGRSNYRWNQPQDAPILKNIVDFYSPHIYGYDRKVNGGFPDPQLLTKGYLDALEATDSSKPILIGEFGASNGDSVSDMNLIGSKELQANTYNAVYHVLNTYSYSNIWGSIGYVLYSRNQYPESWAILKDKGDYIYPAGYAVQQITTGTNDAALTFPYSSVPDDLILTLKDNGLTHAVKVGDVVALELGLNKSLQYQAAIRPDGSVTINENLEYLPGFGQFYLVVRPTIAGTITLTVNQIPACPSGQQCSSTPSAVYSTTLSVH